MKENVRSKIKEFMWGGANKKARVRWDIMIKHPDDGGT